MLAVVLLAVVAAALGVDAAPDAVGGERAVEDVERSRRPSSITATTRAAPSVPVSQGCPPLSA